jgi:hypothetical protein
MNICDKNGAKASSEGGNERERKKTSKKVSQKIVKRKNTNFNDLPLLWSFIAILINLTYQTKPNS